MGWTSYKGPVRPRPARNHGSRHGKQMARCSRIRRLPLPYLHSEAVQSPRPLRPLKSSILGIPSHTSPLVTLVTVIPARNLLLIPIHTSLLVMLVIVISARNLLQIPSHPSPLVTPVIVVSAGTLLSITCRIDVPLSPVRLVIGVILVTIRRNVRDLRIGTLPLWR